MLKLTRKRIALSLLLLLSLEHTLGTPSAYAAPTAGDFQTRERMPESAASQKAATDQEEASASFTIEQQNAVLEFASEPSPTAWVTPTAPPPYMKTVEFETFPSAVAKDLLTVDRNTNSVVLKKADGSIYSGTYQPSTKKAVLTSSAPADGIQITLDFVEKAGASAQYPDLALSSMRFKQGLIQKDYKFSAAGELEAYMIQNLDAANSESIGITRLDNGRWQVTDQAFSFKDLSLTNYAGYANTSDLAGFDLGHFNDQQNAARFLSSSKTYLKWLGGLFAVLSFKDAAGGSFKEKFTARSTPSGIQTFIVVGEADYRSGQTDDIWIDSTFQPFENLPGYTLSFGESIEGTYSQGSGLVFTSPTGIKTVVDFPAGDLLKASVNGQDRVFRIFVDADRLIRLTDVTDPLAQTKTETADLFAELNDGKDTWDRAAADLESRLAAVRTEALQNQLPALFAQADQIKRTTQDRATLDLLSAWTAQALQLPDTLPASDKEPLTQELARLRTASQNVYADALSEKNAVETSQNFGLLKDALSSLRVLSVSYEPGTPGSLADALTALQASVATLEGRLQSAAATLADLQNKVAQLLAGLTVPEKNKINTVGWEDSVYVTPDGKTMYFSYAPNNFYDYLISGGQAAVVSAGPDRDGHHASTNPFENSDLYVSTWVDGKWTAPVNMGINSAGLEASAMVSADGNSIYISKPAASGSDQMDLYVARKSGGVWGSFQAMNIPKVAGEYAKTNPHIAADGKKIYFAITRDVNGQRNSDLYFSALQSDGKWGVPQSLGAAVNTAADEKEAWVSPDETAVYFTRGWELYSAKKIGGVWQQAVKLDFGENILGGDISLTADQKQLFFSQVDVVKKDRVIVTSYLQPDGRWSKPIPVEDVNRIPTTSLPPGSTFDSTSYVDLNAPAVDFNKMILGSNTQWTDNGDEMLIPGTLNFDPEMLAKAKAMAPTVLRYPGGELSDSYNWRNGIGTLENRYAKASANTRSQPILFGTDEMLRLSDELGAEPIFTVNIMTMTAQDAADWVRYTNVPNSRVKYWEIGNEPYLNSSITPEQYAAKVNDFIKAMKAVDPGIQFGVALRTSTMGDSDFNERFLAAATEKFDYVTVHNAYFPLSFYGDPSDEDLYEAAMASTEVIRNDFAYFDALLKKARPGQNIPLAVTEFNAIFSVQGNVIDSAKTPTFTSALYIADLLAAFAKTPNLLMANFWSLTGNGDFGAVSNTGETRPVYEVFTAYAELMKGRLVTLDTQSPVFENASVGLVFSNQNDEAVTTLATLEENTLRVMALNKDIDNASDFRLMLPAGKTIVSVRVKKISESDLFGTSTEAEWVEVPCVPHGDYLDLNLDPHSISFLEIVVE